MDETIWFLGERGQLLCMDRDKMTPPILFRFKSGELRQVNPDGTPWTGRAFWLKPLPEPAETTISTLRGYRAWSVGKRGMLSSAGAFLWADSGCWSEALCRSGEHAPPPSPDNCGGNGYGYGCGLYAASTPTSEVLVYGKLWGVIEAKGRIVLHARGLRAQFARPAAFVIPEDEDRDKQADLRERARVAAARYAVPLLSEAAVLAEYAPDSWAPASTRE